MENIEIFYYVDDIMMNPDGTPRTPGKGVEHLILTTKSSKNKSQTKGATDSPAIFKKPLAPAPKKKQTSKTSKTPSRSTRICKVSTESNLLETNQTDQLAIEVSKLKLRPLQEEISEDPSTSDGVSCNTSDSGVCTKSGRTVFRNLSGINNTEILIPFETNLTYIKQERLSPMDREGLPPLFPPMTRPVLVKKEPIDSGDVTNVKTELGWIPSSKTIKEEMIDPDENKENRGVLPSAKLGKPSTSKGTDRVRKERTKKGKSGSTKKDIPRVLSPRTHEKVREEAIKSVALEEPRSKFLRTVTMSSGQTIKATFIAPRGVRFPDEVNTREIEEYHDNYQYYLARKFATLRKNELEKRTK